MVTLEYHVWSQVYYLVTLEFSFLQSQMKCVFERSPKNQKLPRTGPRLLGTLSRTFHALRIPRFVTVAVVVAVVFWW